MHIHTNTNTILYQRWWKSWSLRQLVQPLFSSFSRLPMVVSTWQAWRSLRHKVVRSVSHFVYKFVEFPIVLRHGQSPILSSSFLDMDRVLFFRTSHLTNWVTNLMSQRDFCCERRSDKCARHCNPPTDWVGMTLVCDLLTPTASGDDAGPNLKSRWWTRPGVGWELRRLYYIFILSCVWSGESWAELERLGESRKWQKSLISY